jgi:chromosome segregation ATPase
MEPEVEQRFERIEAILEAVSRSQAASEARFENYFAKSEERFAKSETRFAKSEARFAKSEARIEKLEAHFEKLDARFEKRMKGFEKLAQIGIKEIAQLRRAQRQTDERINALIDSQQRTEASLRRFLDSMGNGTNGR